MPPAPSGETTSYEPTRVPATRVMLDWGARIIRGLFLPIGIVRGINVGRARRPGPGDLDCDAFAARHGEVIRVRRFRIDASRRQHLQPRLVEFRAISEVPHPGDHGGDAIVGMRVSFDPRVRTDPKEHRVEARLRRVALQNHSLGSGYA